MCDAANTAAANHCQYDCFPRNHQPWEEGRRAESPEQQQLLRVRRQVAERAGAAGGRVGVRDGPVEVEPVRRRRRLAPRQPRRHVQLHLRVGGVRWGRSAGRPAGESPRRKEAERWEGRKSKGGEGQSIERRREGGKKGNGRKGNGGGVGGGVIACSRAARLIGTPRVSTNKHVSSNTRSRPSLQ